MEEVRQCAHVNVSEDFGMVWLIGSNVAASPTTISSIFSVLEDAGILVRMVSLGAASINVSLVVKRDDVERAVQVLHDKMILSDA